MERPIFGTCTMYRRSWTNMPEPSFHCYKNSINQTQVVIEIQVIRTIQRIDYAGRDESYSAADADADAATIPTATATATVPPGVTFSYEELPTIVKLFPIKFDDLLSPDMLGNCDLTSLVSAIEDFVPGSTPCTSFLNDCKQQIKSHFMKDPSLRPDGEKKPSLLSVSIPIQVVKVIETYYHYDDVEEVHSHDIIDVNCLRTPEIEQLFSRSYSTFFSLLKMKKFDGTNGSGECSICLQDYDEKNDGDDISLSELPCTHVFHTRCIIHSLDAKSRCPICRYHFRVQPLQKSCASSSS